MISMRISLTVKRYLDGKSFEQRYSIDVEGPGVTILDVLMRIRNNVDGSLAFRYYCRMGLCGACAIKVNGKPVLACKTKLSDVGVGDGGNVVIEPISNNVIKDLIINIQ